MPAFIGRVQPSKFHGGIEANVDLVWCRSSHVKTSVLLNSRDHGLILLVDVQWWAVVLGRCPAKPAIGSRLLLVPFAWSSSAQPTHGTVQMMET
jgi:hypothetical protein